jgi:alkanesulfonate monooxygenase SsuD/methylene tetrahydromethanopterin reductase-like flavin-dependent oxidoreductase (luciferase family)
LYRQTGRKYGYETDRLKVAVYAIGFVGESPEQASSSFFPPYHAVFDELGRKVGRPPLTWEQFVSMTAPGESLVVGDKVEVATKIARIDHELGGVSRICLQMAVGPIDRENRLGSIERLVEIAKYIGG